MSYPLVSDLKCWISYHLSLDLHFAHIPTLSYPPVLCPISFFLSSFFCVSILYVSIPLPPFSFPWSRVRWKPRATIRAIWARGNGQDPRSSHVSSHVSCQVGRWVIVRQELNLRVSDLLTLLLLKLGVDTGPMIAMVRLV